MRKTHVVLLIGFAAATFLSIAAPAAAQPRAIGPPPPHADFVPGQLLVEFRADASVRDMSDVVRGVGATVVRKLPGAGRGTGRLVLVRSSTLGTDSLAAAFGRSPLVVKACPNYYRHVDAAPDDPGLVEQWGLTRIGAPQAWEASVGSSAVVVASIDTGVDYLHPDLAANMWQNPGEVSGNGLDDDGNGYVDDIYGIDTANHDSNPMDDFGHGTHTSGIIAAVGDNATGIAGTGWHTRIMALKFLDFDGWGTDAGAIGCIDYAVHEKLDHSVNVVAINASWGWRHNSPLLREAIERAGAAGIVFCASAGNDREDSDRDPHFPSSFSCDNIISVAATSEGDTLAYFSNWGSRRVDLGAPGVDILSTLPRFPFDYYWDEEEPMYGSWSGTSMAAPFVAGTVAVCAAADAAESMSQRIERILSSTDRLPTLRGRCVSGGRLDLSAALGEGSPSADLVPPQTTVVGCDSLWHDAPVRLRFWAGDGAGGSGVARTRWRLDGGAWQSGSLAVVSALPNTKAARTIDYRSTDRAGNVEATQSCQVEIDTTGPADGEIPGVPLPPSPVVGNVAWRVDRDDVFSIAVNQGESLRVVAAGVPGMGPRLSLYPPGAHWLEGSRPVATSVVGAGGNTLTYCAETSGTYYLDVGAAGANGSYRLTWDVVPIGVDVTAPYATVKQDYSGGWFSDYWDVEWYNRPVTLAVLAVDGPLGSGVDVVETSLDDGFTWTAGQYPVVPAPADHSNDGVHLVRYRATDLSGNTSPQSTCIVAIDTAGPVTETWVLGHAVYRGDTALVRFNLRDLTSEVRSQLVIQSVATGSVVKTQELGWSQTGRHLMALRCDLPRGTYALLIAGTTHDGIGNLWESAICSRYLRVR
jgi:subtilisin family serine protease